MLILLQCCCNANPAVTLTLFVPAREADGGPDGGTAAGLLGRLHPPGTGGADGEVGEPRRYRPDLGHGEVGQIWGMDRCGRYGYRLLS